MSPIAAAAHIAVLESRLAQISELAATLKGDPTPAVMTHLLRLSSEMVATEAALGLLRQKLLQAVPS